MEATKKLVDAFGRDAQQRKVEQELQDEANAEAKEHWDDPAWRQEFAADLTESIFIGFEFETLVDRFIDTERVNFEDRVLIEETQGLQAFWTARGGYIEQSQLTSEVEEVPRDMVGVHVMENEDKLRTNFARSAQTLRTRGVQRIDAEVNRRVITSLQAAVPNTSAYYTSAAGVGQTALDEAIRRVLDETELGEVTIAGRSTMTHQISGFSGFADVALEEIRLKGVLGTYKGAQVVTLKNFKDENGNAYIPGNELWVIARDVGKFAFFGGQLFKEHSEGVNWYWHYVTRRDAGVLINHAERSHRVIDSNLAA